MTFTIVRRDFLKCALASALVIPTLGAADARAADLPLLDPSDPVAQSLGFVPDASKVGASASPTFKPGQHCGVCMQYQGKAADAVAGCGIFAGHSVPSRGWCSAFAQRS
jgi:High potential iron-sulfur protein